MTGETNTTKPHQHANLPALVYKGEVIHERHEMLSLTDMWKAAGAPEEKRPGDWLALSSTAAFREAVEATLVAGKSGIQTKRGGRGIGGVTFAHWHLAMAYAKYLDHDFHMWCNEVVRARMEGAPLVHEAIAEDLGPQARKVIGGLIKSIMPGVLAEALTVILPAMVREHVAGQHHAVIEGVSAGQVIAMAGVNQRNGLRGLPAWVSSRLRRFHAQRGVAVRLAALGSRTTLMYDPLICREWLANGGKAEIERKVSERRGQGTLRLI